MSQAFKVVSEAVRKGTPTQPNGQLCQICFLALDEFRVVSLEMRHNTI
jgi:hypothetical protein